METVQKIKKMSVRQTFVAELRIHFPKAGYHHPLKMAKQCASINTCLSRSFIFF
jgi:hypothetical protein